MRTEGLAGLWGEAQSSRSCWRSARERALGAPRPVFLGPAAWSRFGVPTYLRPHTGLWDWFCAPDRGGRGVGSESVTQTLIRQHPSPWGQGSSQQGASRRPGCEFSTWPCSRGRVREPSHVGRPRLPATPPVPPSPAGSRGTPSSHSQLSHSPVSWARFFFFLKICFY